MPRYFFHLHDDVVVCDPEGIELLDDDAARTYAISNIRSLICEQVQHGTLCLKHRIQVVDDLGRTRAVMFDEAIEIQ